jgi:CHAT domain-containing protein
LERLPPLDIDRANLLLAQGRVAAARRLAARVARHTQASDWPGVAARALITLARCALAGPEPNPAAALAHAGAARALAERYGLPERAGAAHALGQAHARAGDIAAAGAAFAAAVAAAEELRARLPVDELQLGFVDGHLPIYRDAAHLSLLHDSPAAGLAALSLALSAPLARKAGSPPTALAAELEGLREAWHWHQSRMEDLAESRGEGKALASRLRAIEADLADLTLRRDVLAISDAPDELPAPHAPEQLAAALSARLAPHEGLLLIAPADDRVALVLVTPGGVVRRVAPAPALERTLRSWRFHLQYVVSGAPVPQAMAAARAHLARFHAALVAPIADELSGLRRLVVALDPAWHDLPLAAAFDGERYLIERLEVAYCSAPETLLADILPPGDLRAPALVIGHSDNGRLPAALGEAKAVAALLAGHRSAELLLEDEASPARVRAALPGCGLLHVASHAAFRADNPRFSWVRLAGGRLSVADLGETQLRARPLVVLSACETGRGRPRGGGLLGMGRAMLAAGASGLVASLWEIADAGTAALMRNFYAAYIAGAPAAAALAAAQRSACASGEHPFYWAGFVCIER